MAKLDGKVAVVTGASKGIGASIALHLAAEGAAVVVNYASSKEGADRVVAEIAGKGGKAVAVQANVANQDDIRRLFAEAQKAFGRLDILVNNAGIYPLQAFEETSFELWRQVMSVNVDGMFHMCQAFLPGMRERRYGRIVNITTTVPWLSVPDFTAYAASKMAVIGLTRGLASEYGEHGVTVNAAAPSLVRTATTESGPQAQMFEGVASMQAIKRVQQPEDMVGTIAFLASDDAAFTTGQTLICDGGLVRV